jgi:hypothetical protein
MQRGIEGMMQLRLRQQEGKHPTKTADGSFSVQAA